MRKWRLTMEEAFRKPANQLEVKDLGKCMQIMLVERLEAVVESLDRIAAFVEKER